MRKERISQILGNLDPQYIDEAAEYTGSGKAVPKWLLPMVACLCIAIAATLTLLSGGNTTPENILQVNESTPGWLADYDARTFYYDQLSEKEKAMMIKQFKSYLGFSYNSFAKRIPAAFSQESFSYIEVRSRGEYRLSDYVLEYRTESGGTVRIALCASGYPVRCKGYNCNDPLESRINGVSAVIIQIQENHYWVRFSYQRINYDIETKDIPLEQLEELLVGIIS